MSATPPSDFPPPAEPASSFPPPGQTSPAFPPTPPVARRSIVAGLLPRDYWVSVLVPIAAFVVAALVAGGSLLLTLAFSAASSSGSGSTGSGSGLGGSSGSTPSLGDFASVGSFIVGAPVQLVELADLGRLNIAGSIQILGSISGSAHLGFVPGLVAAAQLAALVVGVRLFRRRDLDRQGVLVTSALSGIVLAVVTLVAGLALAMRLPRVDGLDIRGISAVTGLSVVVALAIGIGSTLAARPAWFVGLHPAISRILGVTRTASLHLGLVLVVLTVAAVVSALVTQPSYAAAYPIGLLNIGAIVTSLGFLGGVGASDSAGSLASSIGGGTVSSPTATVFAHTTPWLWLAVLLVIVTVVAAGLALALRRGAGQRALLDWAASVGAYALGGVVLLLLGTVVFSVQVAGQGGSGSAGVTPWTVAVLAGWGAVVEVVARYLAPRLLPALPTRAVAVARRIVGADQLSAGASAGGSLAGATGPFATGAAAPAPLTPRARRILVRSVVGGGIVVVLVVAGAITAGALRSGPFGPGAAAKSYLQALADGDASAAARLSGASSVDSAGLESQAVFSKATGRISDITIGDVQTSGDIATVAYRYTQAGARHDASLRLDRTGTTFLVDDHWRAAPVTGRVQVDVDDSLGDAVVTSHGVKVGTAHDGTLDLTAYPGTYDLTVAGSKYFEGGTKSVTVRPDSVLGAQVSFDAKATARLTTDAEAKVNDLIASCAKSTSADLPDDCPFYGPFSGDASKVTYKVAKQPTLSVTVSGGSVSVTSDKGDGSVHVSYTDSFLGESFDESYDEDITVYEYLTVKDGVLVFDD